MTFLSGYKTYIVAAIMALAGIAQLLGIDVPTIDNHASGQMILEALAVIFMRQGVKSELSNG